MEFNAMDFKVRGATQAFCAAGLVTARDASTCLFTYLIGQAQDILQDLGQPFMLVEFPSAGAYQEPSVMFDIPPKLQHIVGPGMVLNRLVASSIPWVAWMLP